MTTEHFALIALAETTKEYVKPVEVSDNEFSVPKKRNRKNNRREEDRSFFFRIPRIKLKPDFAKLRHGIQKMSCFKSEEDEISVIEVPRHKSIDIGVGLARKMSLFLFTKRSVCMHPYHPFTPKQSTRKIYLNNEEN